MQQKSLLNTSLLLYQTEDGQTRIEVRLLNETVWLTQLQMSELFDKDRRTISEHIQNIFTEKELDENSVCRKFQQTAADGKNYIDEINILNRLVSMYLDFAELQALSHNSMYMKDWIIKLDDFLRVTAREILSHAGTISHEAALEKARAEYTKYQHQFLDAISPVEQHFLQAVKEIEQVGAD